MDCKKNNREAVVVIAIGKSKVWDISKKTIEYYCEKYNIPLEIITEKKFNPIKNKKNDSFNFFEKNQVFDLFKKYDKILRLDWDVLITPNCPNLFNIVPEDSIGIIFEDYGSRKNNRRKRIKNIQKQLGDVNWKKGYINTGVILSSKQHKKIFLTKEKDIKLIENLNMKVSKEQNFFNYRVRKLKYNIFELDYRFNHIKIFSESWNENANRLNSYIIHYAGSKRKALNMIKYDYNRIYLNKIGLIESIKNFLREGEKIIIKLIKEYSHLKNNYFFRILNWIYYSLKKYVINIDY